MKIRRIGPLNQSQQELHKVLSLIEEEALIAILRAVRLHPERTLLVDAVNAELDRGVALMDFFSDTGYSRHVLKDGFLMINLDWGEIHEADFWFGSNGEEGAGTNWRIEFDASGNVLVRSQANLVWSPEEPL